MKAFTIKVNLGFFFIASFLVSSHVWGQSPGEQIFSKVCFVCHTIGQGRKVGPDLANVHQRRPEEWILKFVKSSQAVVQSGDPYAVALFEEFNKVVMPDQPLSDEEMKSVIEFIKTQSPQEGAVAPVAKEEKPKREVTPEDIKHGAQLFQGKTRLAGRGPACISCHNVKNDAVWAGGVLAKDLTDAFSRLTDAGIRPILGSPPFPMMQRAYKNRALSEDEVHALVAFLEHVDKERFYQRPKDYGLGLFYVGAFGALFLMGLYSLIWFRRKKFTVYKDIFDRQIKSS